MPGRKHSDETRRKISAGVKTTLTNKKLAANPTQARAKQLHDNFEAATSERISPRVRNLGDIGRDLKPFVPPSRFQQQLPPSDAEIQAQADALGMKRAKQKVQETAGERAAPRPQVILTNGSQDRQAMLRDQKARMTS